MRRKVLLFNPKSEFYAMPRGLLAVGSALDPDRFEVRIFDERLDGQAAARIISEAEGAACVGMTVFSGAPIRSALDLSREVKQRFPDVPVVWGGWHPSILPEQCIASRAMDAVVIAQGEPAFRELLNRIDDRSAWQSIAGLCIEVAGKPVRTA
ncbi:MAG: cobalamin B12-binding domain-containing protein, partial [Acidobacteria bacterium]|nr:cobalamin B12-binding domain-containing protein [Acidobacteriota bacterium]